MTTYRGGEIPQPDQLDTDLKLVGARLGGMENVEEELNLPPEAGSDMLRRPGMKGYMETRPMAEDDPSRSPPIRIRDLPAGSAVTTTHSGPASRLNDFYMKPGGAKEAVRPISQWDYEQDREDRDESGTYKTGGVVQTKDPMPSDQRKLADRINVNEIMQMQDDARYPGWGTTRETMPPSPTTEQYNSGGRVKHGSSTRVTCKTKHGG